MPRRVTAVDADRIRERLVALIRIPSMTGEEDPAIHRIATWLQEADVEVDYWFDGITSLVRDPSYGGHEVDRAWVPVVAGMVRGDRPGPTVMLTGHIDVVPPGDYSHWNDDPFSGVVDGDRVIGRGAADMKSGVIAALEAFEAFVEGPRDFAGRVIFLAVPAEEDSGLGTLAAIRRGWTADVAILPEPTVKEGAPQILVAHAGAISLSVTVPGLSVHASIRQQGESALSHFLAIHEAMRRDEAATNEAETDPLMLALGLPYSTNVGIAQGGEWSSTVMDGLTAQVRIGVPLNETVREAQDRFTRAVLEATRGNPWLEEHPPTVKLEAAGFGSARVPSDHPVVDVLRAAGDRAFDREPEVAAAPYGCDMAGWVRLAGVPTVLYGPGDIAHAHAPDESVSLDRTIRVARALVEATEDLLEHTTDDLALLR